jgi:hypothetical protein
MNEIPWRGKPERKYGGEKSQRAWKQNKNENISHDSKTKTKHTDDTEFEIEESYEI